jgi:hypothetical protein
MTYHWPLTRYVRSEGEEGKAMELVFTTLAIIAGMSFSLAVALFVEELIFGKVFRVFFKPRASQAKAVPQR